MIFGDRPQPTLRNDPPMWVHRKVVPASDQDSLAAIQIDVLALQQAIREQKRGLDVLRMLSGLSIGIGILALAAVTVMWGMR